MIPEGDGYRSMITDPLQAKSMFTQLFFLKGHGLECFDLFDERRQVTGGMIYVWKVDWEGKDKNILDEFKEEPEEVIEEVTGDTIEDGAEEDSSEPIIEETETINITEENQTE